MNKKLLSIIGVMALLAWTLGGVAAWALTKEGLQITVQEGNRLDQGDDSVALLEDHLGGLEEDLGKLAHALGQNFQRLQENLSEESSTHGARLEARIDALERELVALRAERRREQELMTERSSLVMIELGRIAEGQKVIPSAGAQASESTPGAKSTPVASSGSADSAASSRPSGPETPAKAKAAGVSTSEPQKPVAKKEPEPRRAKKKRSFLSFELPGQTVAFDKRQHWKVIPSLSRVGFDGKSTLHDFSGVTSKLSGSLDVDLAHPEKSPKARVQVRAAMLKTGVEGRDEEMYTTLDTKQHPQISFDLISFVSKTVDANTEQVMGVAHGKMTIRGVSQEVDMTTTLSLDKSRRLHIDGEMELDMTDYKVTPPSKMGLVGMDKTVKVWIRLRARVQEKSKR